MRCPQKPELTPCRIPYPKTCYFENCRIVAYIENPGVCGAAWLVIGLT